MKIVSQPEEAACSRRVGVRQEGSRARNARPRLRAVLPGCDCGLRVRLRGNSAGSIRNTRDGHAGQCNAVTGKHAAISSSSDRQRGYKRHVGSERRSRRKRHRRHDCGDGALFGALRAGVSLECSRRCGKRSRSAKEWISDRELGKQHRDYHLAPNRERAIVWCASIHRKRFGNDE